MQIFQIKGNGHFTSNEGKEVSYPINKLVVQNSRGDSLEFKLDKTQKMLLPYLFNQKPSGTLTEDEAGNEVEVIYLTDIDNEKKVVIE